MDGTLELRTLIDRNKVVQGDFQEFDIRGQSERYNISYRQPLIRTPRQELALSLGFTYRNGQTFTFAGPTPFGFGPNEDGVSRTSCVSVWAGLYSARCFWGLGISLSVSPRHWFI